MFDLLATDVGRPVGHIRHRLVYCTVSNGQRGEGNGSASQTLAMAPTDLEAIAAEVIVSEQEYDCDAQDQARNWYSLRVHPYKSNDGKVNGSMCLYPLTSPIASTRRKSWRNTSRDSTR